MEARVKRRAAKRFDAICLQLFQKLFWLKTAIRTHPARLMDLMVKCLGLLWTCRSQILWNLDHDSLLNVSEVPFLCIDGFNGVIQRAFSRVLDARSSSADTHLRSSSLNYCIYCHTWAEIPDPSLVQLGYWYSIAWCILLSYKHTLHPTLTP